MARDGVAAAVAPREAASAVGAVTLLVAGTQFMENLDANVIAPAMPRMAESFGVAPVDLNAGISAYLVALGVFIPVSGWVAARFGARPVFALAILVFTLASMGCGLVSSLPAFLAFRVLQGIGGAMMVPVGRLIVLRVTPKERLIGAIARLTWPALVAPVIAPPLGGLIADHAGWRWIFWLNLPLGALALAVALWVVPRGGARERRPFDWGGFALLGPAILCLLVAAELLGQAGGGALLPPLLLGLLGAGLLAAGLRHLRRSPHPMLRFEGLAVPSFAVTIRSGTLFRMGVSAVPFLVPLMFQLGFGWPAFEAGLLLMAVFAGNLLMKPLTTPVLRRWGFRRVLVVNGLANAMLLMACGLIGPWLPLPAVCALLFVGGMARSMQFTALNTIAFADIPREGMTDANALFSTVFQMALGLGVAVAAMCWRLGEAILPAIDPADPFRLAFVLTGLLAGLGVREAWKLAPDVAAHVARGR